MTSGRDEVARPEAADPAGDESLADALGAVARQLREKSAETLAPWDITPAYLRALRTLSRHGTMRLSELSERLQIAPRTATEVVDALQSRDLVRRRADPGDRRATLVEVTEHGAEILAEIRAARGTEAGRVFGRLGPADRAELARILGQLRDKPSGAGQRLADPRGAGCANQLHDNGESRFAGAGELGVGGRAESFRGRELTDDEQVPAGTVSERRGARTAVLGRPPVLRSRSLPDDWCASSGPWGMAGLAPWAAARPGGGRPGLEVTMGGFRRLALLILAAAFAVGVAGVSLPAAGAQAAQVPRSAAQEAGAGAKAAGCARDVGQRRARCYLAVEPASPRPVAGATATCTVNESAGYTPCNLQSAYELTKLSPKDGKGNMVAVVDPYDDPNAESDLGTYRSTYGLPACTTANGCFKKVNQDGVQGSYPAANAGSAQEISVDLDMVSAICPNCHILLVEANSNGFGDLGTAINEAVTLGAKVVSDSWGTGEFDGETGWDGNVDHPGVAITFSSGDGAYVGGVQYPSASPYVTSVGGTELTPATNTRGWTESVWVTPGKPPTQGSGSGCSAYEPKPAWQHDTGCANRTTADVSAVAANVLSYDSYQASGWYYSFGTSVSSPIVAGVYGLANNPSSITIPASAAYGAPASSLHDITKGSTGTCTPTYLCKAGKGYDGPTGLGTPDRIAAFQVPATPPPAVTGISFSGPVSDPSITVTGTNLGTYPPIGTPETCQAGDTGDDYGSSGLWFDDTTQGWTAGQAGDCIGLIVTSWSSTQVVFGFGNEYANYPSIQSGDQVEVEVQGATFTGPLP